MKQLIRATTRFIVLTLGFLVIWSLEAAFGWLVVSWWLIYWLVQQQSSQLQPVIVAIFAIMVATQLQVTYFFFVMSILILWYLVEVLVVNKTNVSLAALIFTFVAQIVMVTFEPITWSIISLAYLALLVVGSLVTVILRRLNKNIDLKVSV